MPAQKTFASNFADFREVPKKNLCEFAKSAASVLSFLLKTVESKNIKPLHLCAFVLKALNHNF